MSLVGDALLEVTDARRINYSILGNTCPELHAHVFPRFASEPVDHVCRPIWVYSAEQRKSAPFRPEEDRDLMTALFDSLHSAGKIKEPGPNVRPTGRKPGRLELSLRAATARSNGTEKPSELP